MQPRLGDARLAPRVVARGVHAFTLLELSVAMAIFLLLASVITMAVGSAGVGAHRQRLDTAATSSLDAALGQLANASYDSLVGDSFTPPDPCSTGPVGAAATSCLYPLGPANGKLVVHWNASVAHGSGGSTHVELTGSATLSDGQAISATDTVDAPVNGYRTGDGEVRAVLRGLSGYNPTSLSTPLLLLDANNARVASSAIQPAGDGTGVALFHVPGGDCTTSSPCHLALRAGADGAYAPSPSGAGGVALTAASVLGPSTTITSAPGTLSSAAGSLYQTGSIVFSLTATNSGGVSGAPPVTSAGSICLWLSFNDGVASRSIPYCNTASASQITASTYAPDSADPAATLALPSGVPLQVSIDDPNGTCPQAPGMVGDTANGWSAAAVCTSWTWGVPASLTVNNTTSAFVGSQVTISPGSATDATVTWSNTSVAGATFDAASPASGYAGEPVWGKPRSAPGCAFDGSCLSLGLTVPEDSICPQQHCLSAAHFAPELTAPVNGPAKVATVAASSSATAFTLGATDPDLSSPPASLTITVVSPPGQGSVSYNGTTLAAGNTIVSNAGGSWSGQLTYHSPPGQINGVTTLTVRLDGGQGVSSDAVIGFYQQIVPWSLTAPEETGAQNSSGTTIPVTVTGTDGNPFAGASVTATSSAAGLSFAGATSNTNGVANLTATIKGAAAGTHPVTLSTSTATGSSSLAVTPVLSKISVSVGPLAEGGTATASLSATDAAGNPFANAPIALSLSGGSGVSLGAPSCLTGDAGTCSVTLRATSAASTSTETLTASSSGVTGTASVPVSPVPEQFSTPSTDVAEGSTATLPVTVEDGTGSPMAGVKVSFAASSSSGLTLSATTATTNSSGVASIQVRAAGTAAAQSDEIKVSAGGTSNAVAVTVTPVATTLVANGPALSVSQGGTATSYVTVEDGAGNPMAGVKVTLHPSSGLSTASSVLSSSPLGQADITVSASKSTAPGTGYEITASTSGVTSATLPVTVTKS